MTALLDRWQQYRDEKNDCNRQFGARFFDKTLSEQETSEESALIQRYNDLYALMTELEAQFTDDDWTAYDAEQDMIREMEHQAWLIENRYGSAKPAQGISDW